MSTSAKAALQKFYIFLFFFFLAMKRLFFISSFLFKLDRETVELRELEEITQGGSGEREAARKEERRTKRGRRCTAANRVSSGPAS